MKVTAGKIRDLLDKEYALTGQFSLSSGSQSAVYVDCRAAMLEHPRTFRKFLEGQLERLGWPIPVATGTGGALMLATVGAGGYLYNPKGHGVPWSPDPLPGEEVVLLDDVRTTGATLSLLRDACREAGLIVTGEIVLYDRADPAFATTAYLASPYTSELEGIPQARYDACVEAVARLQARGDMVFSPIVHSHPPAVRHGLPTDFGYWQHMNRVFISRMDQFWVLNLNGWRHSAGVKGEAEYAASIGKPAFLLDASSLSLTALGPGDFAE